MIDIRSQSKVKSISCLFIIAIFSANCKCISSNKTDGNISGVKVSKIGDTPFFPIGIYSAQSYDVLQDHLSIFKEIKAKSNINPSIDQRVRLDDEHIEKIYNLAEKVISLHNYKYIK